MPELHFKGKEFVYNHHLSVPYRPLVPQPDKSILPAPLAGEAQDAVAPLDGNLIIHGDNLHALKALLPRYAGKVDCIFIDPPYNTGNENWCYNDNVNSPLMKEWLSTNPVNKEDMLRHDKWLAMMWPRLKLLHELLSENGSFWMTLDDNEIHRARMMLDEIFGEGAFVSCIVWQKKYAVANDHTGIAPMHDLLVVYQKSQWRRNLLERQEENDLQYRYEDEKGVFRPDNYTCNKTSDERPNLYYPIINPYTKENVWPNKNSVWRYSKDRHQENIANGFVFWGKDGTARVPSYKRYRHLLKGGGGIVPGTWWSNDFAGHTDAAKKELREIMPDMASLDSTITPKPTLLLERILQIATDTDSLVLDSYAGSATTAHAVLEANKKDGGKRRFILVECEDYADRLTAERVRRVMRGYEFTGTQREELLRENLTFTSLKKADELLAKVDGIERRYTAPEAGKTRVTAKTGGQSGQTGIFGEEAETPAAKSADTARRFDKITKTVKDGVLLVTGETQIKQRTEGLGGAFTFCTLGEPLDIDRILTGENLPDFAALGAWLFHTATGEALSPSHISTDKEALGEWHLGESSGYFVWLIYRPDLGFLKSRDSALTLSLAESIGKAKSGKKHLVFAPAKYVPNKTLLPLGVEYSPLPFALYRVEK